MKKNKQKQQQLRLIAGKWRGRKLQIADAPGLRPTGDRIRETLFNWLQNRVIDAHCLDLFGGTGALGLEALSRGAKTVTFIEKNVAVAQHIQQHCQQLKASQGTVITDDTISWLQHNTLNKQSIHIAFIDPPFADELWDEIIIRLNKSQLLHPEAWIYVETPKQWICTVPNEWQLYREKQTGGIRYCLYNNQKSF